MLLLVSCEQSAGEMKHSPFKEHLSVALVK